MADEKGDTFTDKDGNRYVLLPNEEGNLRPVTLPKHYRGPDDSEEDDDEE